MQILELHTLTSAQIDDLLTLMRELDPTIPVTAEMLQRVADAPETHLFCGGGCRWTHPRLRVPLRLRLPDGPESQRGRCRGGLRIPGPGNRKGADGRDYRLRPARPGSPGPAPDLTAGTGGGE